jgi:CRP-like cAMP-binding protein
MNARSGRSPRQTLIGASNAHVVVSAPSEGATRTDNVPENQILRALGRDGLARLSPHLKEFSLKQHTVLYEVDAPIKEVYFIEAGMVSFLTLTSTGEAIETGIVGREGLIGSNLCISGGPSLSQVTVQLSGSALRMDAGEFIKAYDTMPALYRLVNRHIGVMLFQAQQNGVCHALHNIEGRLCRWLLQAQDVVRSDVVEMTQEFLSHMLTSQRSSVSVAANSLQTAGLIRYSRGRIEIVNRAGLEDCACECYAAIREQVSKALAPPRR